MPASSFAGTNIRVELGADGASPTWEKAPYTTTRHVPGGNTDVTQTMGYGHGVLTARLFLDAAEWTALQAQLLTEGALILAGVAQGTCLLETLGGPVRHVNGWVTVQQATFRKTAAG